MNKISKIKYIPALILAALALWAGPGPALAAVSNDEFLDLCAESGLPGQADAIKKAIDEGADVNHSGPEGLTPLMVFVAGHNDGDWQAVASVRALLKAGARVNDRSREGGTALSYAVLHKAGPRIISTLIQHGADVNLGVSGRGGLTPLMLAASLDPDPVICALLMAAGADPTAAAVREGQSVGLAELAAQNPNPKVRRFLDAAVQRSGPRPQGRPLFADLPDDPELAAAIADLDGRIRARIGQDNWMAWLGYIRWQTEVAASVELRRLEFGNRRSEAWLNEYSFYLEALIENGGRAALAAVDETAGPARLLIQGSQREERGLVSDLIALADRRIVVMRRPGRGALVAYETDSGRELWRYTPSALSDFHLLSGGPGVEPLILVASHWGQSFGDAAVLDPVNGRVLMELPPSDSPKWTLDPTGQNLAVSTDYSLHIFNLAEKRGQRQSWSWYDLLESLPWEEAQAQARQKQNEILTPLGLSLDETGRFKGRGFDLFQNQPEADPAMLEQARQALAAHNYRQLDVLGLDRRGLRDHSFVLGPACVENCGPTERSAPLFLVNKRLNRIDCLMIDNDPQRILTRADLGWTKGADERLKPLISFSPGGQVLALAEGSGQVHFFAVADGGRHLGRLAAETVLDPASGLTVRDARLMAVLDDDLTGQPFCAFDFPDRRTPTGLMVELDLAAGQVTRSFSPRPGPALGLTAFAASADDRWAVALENGALWRIDPDIGGPVQIPTQVGRKWTALAFSGDGRRLAAADREGNLHLFEDGRASRQFKLEMSGIRLLALDQTGRTAWAAADHHGQSLTPRPALALVDLEEGRPPVYRPGRGRVVSLEFRPEAGYAAAVEDLAPTSIQIGPVKPMEVVRWSQGRTDLIQFDHRRPLPDGKLGGYDLEKSFVGISPDLSAVLFQELKPSQAFVHLGWETVGDRESAEMESFTYQAWLGQAVFSPGGQRRLALLPERGRVGNDDGAWPFNAGGAFYLYDLATGREISYMSDRTKHPDGIIGGAFSRRPGRAVTAGRDGTLRLWDLTGVRPVNALTWVFLENGHWAALDHDGRFDGPDLDGLAGLHWTVAGRTIPLDAFLQDFYQPGLTAYVLAGKELPPLVPVQDRDLSQPEVKIVGLSPEKEYPGRVAVNVKYDGPQDSISQMKLYRNGRLAAVGPEAGPDGQLSFRRVALPRNRQEAFFTVSAFNRDQVRSRSPRAGIKYQLKRSGQPRLHLVAVGAGQFDNPAWDLPLAAAEAQSLAAGLPGFFSGSQAEVRSLTGGQEQGRPTRTNLRATLAALAPSFSSAGTVSGSGPDDTVVLTFSGRGLSSGRQFRLLPADIPGQDQSVTPELLAQSISMEDLAAWLAPVDAAEMALIIKARPQDGGPAGSPGPLGDRALGLLAYDKGLRPPRLIAGDRPDPSTLILLTQGLEVSQSPATQAFRDWLNQTLASRPSP